MCTILKARASRGTEFLGLNGLLGEKILKFCRRQAYAAWTMSNFCQNCCSNILKPYLKEIITKLLMFLQIDSGYTPVGAVVARGISLNLVAQEIELEAKF
nr:importin-5-like [Ipomoea batatas]GME20670.1 importin-5-like [Ipomoea batatas]